MGRNTWIFQGNSKIWVNFAIWDTHSGSYQDEFLSQIVKFETEGVCELFWVFGDNLEYFSSTNSLFLTFGVLEIFVDKESLF